MCVCVCARVRSWSLRDGQGQGRYASWQSTMNFYVSALYFAAMTASSVGYGDISASPNSDVEKVFVSIAMLVSACFWAYIVGILTDLLSGGNRCVIAQGSNVIYQSQSVECESLRIAC